MTPSRYALALPPGWGAVSDCRDSLWARLEQDHPQLVADCRARAERYAAEHDGQGLDPLCGRQWLAEAYQECLDELTYLLLEALRLQAHIRAGYPEGRRLRYVRRMITKQTEHAQEILEMLQEDQS